MKKILIITDTFFEQMGGSHIAVSSTAHELLKRGYDVKLIFFNNGVTHKKIKLMSVISRYDIVHYFGAAKMETLVLSLVVMMMSSLILRCISGIMIKSHYLTD